MRNSYKNPGAAINISYLRVTKDSLKVPSEDKKRKVGWVPTFNTGLYAKNFCLDKLYKKYPLQLKESFTETSGILTYPRYFLLVFYGRRRQIDLDKTNPSSKKIAIAFEKSNN